MDETYRGHDGPNLLVTLSGHSLLRMTWKQQGDREKFVLEEVLAGFGPWTLACCGKVKRLLSMVCDCASKTGHKKTSSISLSHKARHFSRAEHVPVTRWLDYSHC